MPVQNHIIAQTNRFLRQKGYQVSLNKTGTCNGLSILYIKAALEGKRDIFFAELRKMAQEETAVLNSIKTTLLQNVIVAQSPSAFSKLTSQRLHVNKTMVDGKKIKAEFKLGLLAGKEHWASIFDEIKRDGRVYYLTSHNHAIAMKVEGAQFIVYDPNYNEDANKEEKKFNERSFASSEELSTELKKIFNFVHNDFFLQVQVFAHPDATKVAYPDKNSIYERCLSVTDMQKKFTDDKECMFTSLNSALMAQDFETAEYILKHQSIDLGFNDIIELFAAQASDERACRIIETIIETRHPSLETGLFGYFFEFICAAGDVRLFEKLSHYDHLKNKLHDELNKGTFGRFLKNNISLDYLLDYCRNNGIDFKILINNHLQQFLSDFAAQKSDVLIGKIYAYIDINDRAIISDSLRNVIIEHILLEHNKAALLAK